MSKTLFINGENFTDYLTPWGYTVTHRKITGGNEGTMKDGSFTDDPLAYKATICATCMPLTDVQLETLWSELKRYDYVYLRYYDPRIEGYRAVAQCTYTPIEAKERGRGADGNIYWTGITLKFEER